MALNGDRWLERAVFGVVIAGLSAWIAAVGKDIADLKVADAKHEGALLTLTAKTNGDLLLITERIDRSNVTLLRIEGRLNEAH